MLKSLSLCNKVLSYLVRLCVSCVKQIFVICTLLYNVCLKQLLFELKENATCAANSLFLCQLLCKNRDILIYYFSYFACLKRLFFDKTDLGKRTHQCDETQGNNSTRKLSTKAPEEDNFCRNRSCTIVSLCFRRIDENVSLDLFCFVNLTSACSLILPTVL